MSSNAKGALLERKAKELLEAEDYLVHRTIRTPIVKWLAGSMKVIGSHNNDVFGVFDLVGVSTKRGLRFIQVTTLENMAPRRHKVEPVARLFPPSQAIHIEVWGWVGGGKRRNKNTGEFMRRQYFRTNEWRWLTGEWEDTTPESAGRIDQ
jgi:hypothetical protein